GFNAEYESTKQHFRSWLDSWLHSYGPIVTEKPQRPTRLIRPPPSNNPIPLPVLREMEDCFKKEPATKASSLKGFETAVLDEAGHFTGKYFAKTIMSFSIVRPTHVMKFEFQIGRGGLFTASTLGCMAVDRHGFSLSFVPHVQEVTQEG